ncbi:hypothetical protein [Paucibacter sp. DJ2R-2]|uniref:hypothetical protein n=1 Tax=Paucibacter sp. DJ2R-2 TaxID=2893558 RepID=UPI0021E3D9DC|nr:hypothetical protein [Paucibacter sp. DJ2R-2]MCV2419150.1 hypothetical protein [Paucibacter sp. DJ4R-1]MCV2437895.1 hypothetical protein [Paucibacter sp. DJ2R-2]
MKSLRSQAMAVAGGVIRAFREQWQWFQLGPAEAVQRVKKRGNHRSSNRPPKPSMERCYADLPILV